MLILRLIWWSPWVSGVVFFFVLAGLIPPFTWYIRTPLVIFWSLGFVLFLYAIRTGWATMRIRSLVSQDHDAWQVAMWMWNSGESTYSALRKAQLLMTDPRRRFVVSQLSDRGFEATIEAWSLVEKGFSTKEAVEAVLESTIPAPTE